MSAMHDTSRNTAPPAGGEPHFLTTLASPPAIPSIPGTPPRREISIDEVLRVLGRLQLRHAEQLAARLNDRDPTDAPCVVSVAAANLACYTLGPERVDAAWFQVGGQWTAPAPDSERVDRMPISERQTQLWWRLLHENKLENTAGAPPPAGVRDRSGPGVPAGGAPVGLSSLSSADLLGEGAS